MPMLNFFNISTVDMWAIGGACALMILDIIAGLLRAIMQGEFSSSKMREGLGHKAICLLVIMLAVVMQVLALHITRIPAFPATAIVCIYIIIMEVGSIWETVVLVYPALGNSGLDDLLGEYGQGEPNKDDNDA